MQESDQVVWDANTVQLISQKLAPGRVLATLAAERHSDGSP